jgi:hypothetical protein
MADPFIFTPNPSVEGAGFDAETLRGCLAGDEFPIGRRDRPLADFPNLFHGIGLSLLACRESKQYSTAGG